MSSKSTHQIPHLFQFFQPFYLYDDDESVCILAGGRWHWARRVRTYRVHSPLFILNKGKIHSEGKAKRKRHDWNLVAVPAATRKNEQQKEISMGAWNQQKEARYPKWGGSVHSAYFCTVPVPCCPFLILAINSYLVVKPPPASCLLPTKLRYHRLRISNSIHPISFGRISHDCSSFPVHYRNLIEGQKTIVLQYRHIYQS